MTPDAPKISASFEMSVVRRQDAISLAGGDAAFQEQIKSAAVLLLPGRTGADAMQPDRVFAPNTIELFQYLREHAPDGRRIELASTDAQYRELGLHGAELWLAPLLTDQLLVGVVIDLIAGYLADWIRAGLDRSSGRVTSELHVSTPEGTAVAFRYVGPPGPYAETMRELVPRVLPKTLPPRVGNDEG